MTFCKRIIARLDIKGSNVIKGVKYEGLKIVGSPCDLALRYYEAGADEILYLDSVASLYGRNNLLDIIRQAVRDVFIPVTAGGGVSSVSDAAALLAAGADKIAVNTAALQRPELITELAEAFGSQCVVGSIQARRNGPGAWEAMAEAGRERSGQEVLVWMERLQQLGAGEILLTSVDQDGTCAGPDQELQIAAAARTRVPLVLAGGFATTQQVLRALEQPFVAAVCMGAALHRNQLELARLKRELVASAVHLPIRLATSAEASWAGPGFQTLAGQRIGVVDYGMGNQQSLINALEHLGAMALLSSEPDTLQDCEILVLPGVGAFPQGMVQLQNRGLDSWLKQWVSAGNPLLGICLGMQMLFESSEEFGHTAGLGLLNGQVLSLPSFDGLGEPVVLPHIGWNRVLPGLAWHHAPPTEPLKQYFVHSYVATGVDPKAVLMNCRYGHHTFIAGVHQGNLMGFQFHPERSGSAGLSLLYQAILQLMLVE